jgi:hypothetical protein
VQRRVTAITRTAGGLTVNGDHTGYDTNEASDPLALIDDSFLGVSVGALAVTEPVDDLALVEAAVGPVVPAIPSDLVLTELTLILGAILPYKLSLPVQETVLHLAFKCVALSELAGTLAMIDLAYLKQISFQTPYLTVFLEVDDVSSPILDD